jgi:hypothetical protein
MILERKIGDQNFQSISLLKADRPAGRWMTGPRRPGGRSQPVRSKHR